MLLPEVVLWEHLRSGRLNGLRFRRQHPIGRYIIDFYCPSARLAVEVDGIGHNVASQLAHDRVRDRWLSSRGIHVLRFAAADILKDKDLEGVVQTIAHAAAPTTASRSPSPVNGGGTA
jgi:very-short-patch-repair endonuclease